MGDLERLRRVVRETGFSVSALIYRHKQRVNALPDDRSFMDFNESKARLRFYNQQKLRQVKDDLEILLTQQYRLGPMILLLLCCAITPHLSGTKMQRREVRKLEAFLLFAMYYAYPNESNSFIFAHCIFWLELDCITKTSIKSHVMTPPNSLASRSKNVLQGDRVRV